MYSQFRSPSIAATPTPLFSALANLIPTGDSLGLLAISLAGNPRRDDEVEIIRYSLGWSCRSFDLFLCRHACMHLSLSLYICLIGLLGLLFLNDRILTANTWSTLFWPFSFPLEIPKSQRQKLSLIAIVNSNRHRQSVHKVSKYLSLKQIPLVIRFVLNVTTDD